MYGLTWWASSSRTIKIQGHCSVNVLADDPQDKSLLGGGLGCSAWDAEAMSLSTHPFSSLPGRSKQSFMLCRHSTSSLEQATINFPPLSCPQIIHTDFITSLLSFCSFNSPLIFSRSEWGFRDLIQLCLIYELTIPHGGKSVSVQTQFNWDVKISERRSLQPPLKSLPFGMLRAWGKACAMDLFLNLKNIYKFIYNAMCM